MPLPTKVIGGYWENWGSGPTLGNIAPEYNTVFIAFAQGVTAGSGKLQFVPQVQSKDSFKVDVKKLQSRGVKVILSIGGWYDLPNMTWGYQIDTSNKRQEAVASLKTLVSEYGFDGIDWDLEHGINVDSLTYVSETLKRELGADFIIAAVPAPSSDSYLRLARNLGPNLDFIGPQYYDRNMSESQSLAEILNHTKQLIDVVGAGRVGIGVRNVASPGSLGDTGNVVTIATAVSAWTTLAKSFPNLKGMYVWSVNFDAGVGYAFAKTMSKIIGATTTPDTPTVPEFYTVLVGDTLKAIGSRFGINWEDLAKWNDLGTGDVIFVGQTLRLKAVPEATSKTIKDLKPLATTASLGDLIAAYNELLGILQR